MTKGGKTKIERYRAHLYKTVKATDLYLFHYDDVNVLYMITICIECTKNSTTPL